MDEVLRELCDEKIDQLDRFDAARWDFQDRLAEIEAAVDPSTARDFFVPFWRNRIQALREEFNPPPSAFLNHEVFLEAMFVNGGPKWYEDQRAWVEENRKRSESRDDASLLEEDPVGGPFVRDPVWRTSHQMIHTYSHIRRWEKAVGVNLYDINEDPIVVVEFGGGYGAMAKLLWRMARSWGKKLVLIEIDVPFITALQELYLRSVLPGAKVEVVLNASSLSTPRLVEEGEGIYLVPLGSNFAIPYCHLFLSTWALSEIVSTAQRIIAKDLRWFKPQHLLLAHQVPNENFPKSTAFLDYVLEAATHEPLGWGPPGNYYVFQ